jgi:tetratricopeptide (TPR) repeat protein
MNELSEFEQTQAFHKGLKYFRLRQYENALLEFRNAVACEDVQEMKNKDPLFISYYGITLALANSKFQLAQKLCRIALTKGESFPETFVNLGHVYEYSGKKQMAIDTFRNGYRRHLGNVEILSELQRLSPRSKSPVPFLDRDNFVNKYAGILIRRGQRFFMRRMAAKK